MIGISPWETLSIQSNSCSLCSCSFLDTLLVLDVINIYKISVDDQWMHKDLFFYFFPFIPRSFFFFFLKTRSFLKYHIFFGWVGNYPVMSSSHICKRRLMACIYHKQSPVLQSRWRIYDMDLSVLESLLLQKSENLDTHWASCTPKEDALHYRPSGFWYFF